MVAYEPNPISEYYIAYFDILGYKEFFRKTPENEQQFLNAINDAIHKVKTTLNAANNSELVAMIADLEIKIKIFSDNFLLCAAVGTDIQVEKIKLLGFMYIVSEIQRNFIVQYGLFIRGGFTKGRLSYNDDYVFGEGLIEAVELEETTKHPRIAVSDKINNFLEKMPYTTEEAERAAKIEDRSKQGEKISSDDSDFYNKILLYARQEYLTRSLSFQIRHKCNDEVICISYLFCIDLHTYFSDDVITNIPAFISQIAPKDNGIPLVFPNVDEMLVKHKEIVERKLIEYSNYTSFNTNEIKQFDLQESILRKYIWSMCYHNFMCCVYNKPQLCIHTIANCENRHMKLLVFVTDENGNIKQ